jgi:hypothetical protein
MIIEISITEEVVIYSVNYNVKKNFKKVDPKKLLEKIDKIMEEENGK